MRRYAYFNDYAYYLWTLKAWAGDYILNFSVIKVNKTEFTNLKPIKSRFNSKTTRIWLTCEFQNLVLIAIKLLAIKIIIKTEIKPRRWLCFYIKGINVFKEWNYFYDWIDWIETQTQSLLSAYLKFLNSIDVWLHQNYCYYYLLDFLIFSFNK